MQANDVAFGVSDKGNVAIGPDRKLSFTIVPPVWQPAKLRQRSPRKRTYVVPACSGRPAFRLETELFEGLSEDAFVKLFRALHVSDVNFRTSRNRIQSYLPGSGQH